MNLEMKKKRNDVFSLWNEMKLGRKREKYVEKLFQFEDA